MTTSTVIRTAIENSPLLKRGKVRDVYDMGDELLIVATDRISCFDVVLPTPIPGKGVVLTQMSKMWFGLLGHGVRNHLRSTDVPPAVSNEADRRTLEGRTMVVDKAQAPVLPEEVVQETAAKYHEALRLLTQPDGPEASEIPGPEGAR